MRYIELNPVRAAMASDPAEYRWSTVRANPGMDPRSDLQPHDAYLGLGASARERAGAYRNLFDTELDAAELEAIRIHAQKDCVLGSPPFQAQIARMVGRRTALPTMGRPARSGRTEKST